MYADLETSALEALTTRLERDFNELRSRGLSLNMARGKPASDQLDLSMPMLSSVVDPASCTAESGLDCRNYGVLDGLPEAKRLMAVFLDDAPKRVIVGGASSLTLMYDALVRLCLFGTDGCAPWSSLDQVKWLCPVPGYDRHFAIAEALGFQMIPVALTDEGPDMDEVERLVRDDESVKGIWCVPQYANPSGTTYSDDTVRRLATMECAASDFRIMWDNAYGVHHLYDEPARQDRVLDIAKACDQAKNLRRYLKFASTSKVTFPGAGLAALAAGPENLAEIKRHMSTATIGYDKLNQLRHVRFLEDARGVAEHMARHAAILRPKFELVARKLEESLSDVGECSWSTPRGGYFVSFDAPEGCASRIVELAAEAGVTMTGAGATWPYGRDPRDSNIRIAPTLPPLHELDEALDAFVCCVKLAYARKLLESRR
ncbi:MAG: aminotransferase class I/II-fold pyridoxal phosphate-dependent enzyme [Berryella intestinalis]|uniref:aminotransferase class I/II-fold pyridoxal phosphate-dependent enzyme n=1 Tax=Berryella intestinalis TaxID=1531429 RepID=UPI002A527929|nr:aminotransferase class I/II-fold pyridoxal phosphate-dependent enzyme [Berryella intestinalis]MDD7369817.1 aminotransferase class I/II-fold pyridoxal phosphate-dependent enzyme [Berryella intestinalis]MDY3129062.1 aminotransferase class I/II-fold pyridoxal phosphate-dependent enzyme [Berryella intestinalis]